MSEWKKYKLDDLINVKHGYAFKGEFFSDEPTDDILLTPGNFKIGGGFKSDKFKYFAGEYPESYILKEGDILITMTDLSKEGDTLGYAAKVPAHSGIRYLHNQRLGLVEFKNKTVDEDFLYWILRTQQYQYFIVGSATGSTVRHTSPSRIAEYEFLAPESKAEQQKIASILSSLDDKIELNNQMNQTLEQIAQAIFKEWFVDFNFPGFDGNLVDGVPKGWKYDNLGNHLKTVLGGTPSTKNEEFWKNGTIGWINSGKVNEFRITEPSQLITEDAVRSSSTKLLPAKTIVIAITGATLGQISRLEIDACANQSVVGILENGELSSEYIYLWLNNNIAYLLRSATGGAQPHVNKNNVNELDLLIPDSKILALFNSKVSSLFDKISNNCMENLILEKTRNSLLPRLLSKN